MATETTAAGAQLSVRILRSGQRTAMAFASVALLGLVAIPPPLAQDDAAAAQRPCEHEFDSALSASGSVATANRDAVDPRRVASAVQVAETLFRFARTQDALAKLDQALKRLTGKWGATLPVETREEAIGALKRLHACVDTQSPPPLATLTVRTFLSNDEVPQGRIRGGAGTRVVVHTMRIGETRTDGTLTARVPSGSVFVEAYTLEGYAARAMTDLPAGSSRTVSMVLTPDHEVDDTAELELVELDDEDVLPGKATSVTVRFLRDGDRLLPMKYICAIKLRNREDDAIDDLDEFFSIVRGAIVATDPGSVLDRLRTHPGEVLKLDVCAGGGGSEYENTVAFRVE